MRPAAALLAMLLLTAPRLSADYLKLSRAAGLKESPTSDADDKITLAKSAELNLVDDDQTNGYYHVVDPASGLDGFVYRTMGRRFPGTAVAGGAGRTGGAGGTGGTGA